MNYRHELKFTVTEALITRLDHRLAPLMMPDDHQGPNGYTVRSLYFDDLYDSGMAEVEAGVDDRKKFRIRLYNGDASFLRLEKKQKLHGMTRKDTADIDLSECMLYLAGDTPALGGCKTPLARELFAGIRSKGLRPKCIVEYDRYALRYPLGNVRVTFDRNICGTNRIDSFLDAAIPGVPVMPAGQHILEVKYDELLPRYILQALDLGELNRQSFSKYHCVRAITG